MKVAVASLNTAIERLLVVAHNRPGTVHRLTDDRTLPGGKPLNVARVLRQIGAVEPLLFGFAGGATGRLFRDLLAGAGLDGRWVATANPTRVCETLVDTADPEGATVYNAAGPYITGDELAALDELAAALPPDVAALACTGSLPPGVPETWYRDRIADANARGLTTLLDTRGPALAAGAGAGPTIVKVNREELAAAGPDPGATVDGWCRAGTRCVVITDGARPAVAVTPDGAFSVAPAPVRARSGIGSGDAHAAGLLTSLLTRPEAGWTAHLRYAAACGASNAAGILPGLSPDLDLGELAAFVRVAPLASPFPPS